MSEPWSCGRGVGEQSQVNHQAAFTLLTALQGAVMFVFKILFAPDPEKAKKKPRNREDEMREVSKSGRTRVGFLCGHVSYSSFAHECFDSALPSSRTPKFRDQTEFVCTVIWDKVS